jgi:hypothetical protein
MATLGEYATYKIGNKKISYDSVSYYELLMKNVEQEEIIKRLQGQLDKTNGNGKVK